MRNSSINLDTHVTLWTYEEGMRYRDVEEWRGTLRDFFEANDFYDEEGIGGRNTLNQEAYDIIRGLEKNGLYFGGGGAAPIWEIRVTE